MAKKRLLIYGAGAIGRGFVPWVFPPNQFDYHFVDIDRKLEEHLREVGCTSFMTRDNGYAPIRVKGMDALPPQFDAVITAVGCRNFMGLADRFMGTTIPIICMENDSRLPKMMREITGNPNIFFAVPDVITSNTAPLRMNSKYEIVTENGVCYIDERIRALGGKAIYIGPDLMKTEWTMKLYLHNTTHCIVAYLGYLKRKEWVHDAMAVASIQKIASRVMEECLDMIVKIYGVNRSTGSKYAHKELVRFSNTLLFDPILRVAREPLRKLALSERLVGAANLCLQAGFIPTNIIKGILAALEYSVARDPDASTMALKKKMSNDDFLVNILNINKSVPVYEPLMEAMRMYPDPRSNKEFWR